MIADFYIVAFVLTGILSTAMGSIVIIEATKIYQKARRSRNWSSTLGEIIERKVIKRDAQTSSKQNVFDAQIEYKYSVDGKELKGSQLNIGNLGTYSRRKTKVELQINKFTIGQEVLIYYNSSNPEQSSLSVGVGRYHIKEFIFGFIFLILGVALFGLGIILRNH